MPFNCPDTNDYPRKTLAELASAVMEGLGFLDQITGDPVRSLEDLRQDVMDRMGWQDQLIPGPLSGASLALSVLRTDILNRLGLADPTTVSTTTVALLRAAIINALGMGAMSTTLPPGFNATALTWINKAFLTLFHRLELDQGDTTPPTALTADSDTTSLVDSDLILNFAVALGKAQYGQPDAKAYMDMAERALADHVQRRPPNIEAMVTTALTEAHRTTLRRIEMATAGTLPAVPFTADSDVTAIDAQPVFLLALANVKEKVGQPDAKEIREQYEHYMADQLRRSPPNAAAIITKALQSANQSVFRRFELGNSDAGTLQPFTADDDETTSDYQPVFLLAVANLMAKFKMDDAKLAYQEYETYMADRMKRSPPNASRVVRRCLKSAQERLYHRYALFRMERFYTWTLQADERFYGVASNDEIGVATPTGLSVTVKSGGSLAAGTYYYAVSAVADDAGSTEGETLACTPVAITTTATGSVLMQWNEVVPAAGYTLTGYRIYRGTSPSTLQLLETVIPGGSNVDDGTDTPGVAPPASSSYGRLRRLDPRHVTWVGVSSDGNQWRALRKGIPPALYASPQSGVPTHYEVRQCIEVWPAPVDGWELRVKGNFGLDPFDSDTDLTTIDWQAVYLTALGEAKTFYGQPDAPMVVGDARVYVGDLIAGAHMTARYLPGEREPVNAVRPRMAP